MRAREVTFSIMLCLSVSSLQSCISNIRPIEGHVNNGIQIKIDSAENLNYFKGQAHSLHMVVFELASVDGFRKMIRKKKSRLTLLGGAWKHKSIKGFYEFSFQPDSSRIITIDRVVNGRYLGVIAGFFKESKLAGRVKLYSLDMYYDNIFWKKNKAKQLLVEISLGKTSFDN